MCLIREVTINGQLLERGSPDTAAHDDADIAGSAFVDHTWPMPGVAAEEADVVDELRNKTQRLKAQVTSDRNAARVLILKARSRQQETEAATARATERRDLI